MRGKGRADQRVQAVGVMRGNALVQVFIGIRGPGRAEIDADQADHGAHAGLGRDRGGLFREKIHIVKTGGAAANHLGHGQPGPVAHKLGADPAGLGRPDMIVEPLLQRQVVGEAPKQAHGRVGVRVDQAGDQRVPPQLDLGAG